MRADLKSVVKEWLIEEERFDSEIPPESVEGLAVNFAYRFKSRDFTHAVVQPKGEDKVILRSTLNVSDKHRQMLRRLAPEDRIRFGWDLRFGLLWKDTDFELVSEGKDIRQFVFTRILHADGLNKAVFEAAISELHRAILFVSWSLLREDELSQARVPAR